MQRNIDVLSDSITGTNGYVPISFAGHHFHSKLTKMWKRAKTEGSAPSRRSTVLQSFPSL